MVSNFSTYQSILEKAFDATMTVAGLSDKTKTNYQSDVRNFFSWFIQTIQKANFLTPASPGEFVRMIHRNQIEEYKAFQVSEGTPLSTVNRRLSALRMFLKSAIDQEWIIENPAETITNIERASEKPDPILALIGRFEKHLEDQGAAKSTMKNYVSDVEYFLRWLESKTSRP